LLQLYSGSNRGRLGIVPGSPVLAQTLKARQMMREPPDPIPQLPVVNDDRPPAHDPAEYPDVWIDMAWDFRGIPWPEA
jgi:hypothetical protein